MSYKKKTWKKGEVISDERLNAMEEGIEGAYKKLLWENASPNSEFEAQSLDLALSGYEGIEIIGTLNIGLSTPNFISTGYIPMASDASASLIWANNNYIATRAVHVKPQDASGQVRFESATTYSFDDGTTNRYLATHCVPLYIYGIKGVNE